MTSLVSWSDFDRPRWDREGLDWPHREASQFVNAAGIEWHVQTFGDGPELLLIHGTAGATHSWRQLAPALATRFRVIAPDLPAHGFTGRPAPSRMTLPGMSEALRALVLALELRPSVIVGHSAGAALAVRMVVDQMVAPRVLVSLGGAFFPYRGVATRVFSPLAKVLSRSSAAPLFVSWRARQRANIERLIESTGSRLDERGTELYQRLVRTPGHVAGALSMMASWDLGPMKDDLRRLPIPALFVAGAEDRAVSPAESERAARLAPDGRLVMMPGRGHLAHEEAPDETARLIVDACRPLFGSSSP